MNHRPEQKFEAVNESFGCDESSVIEDGANITPEWKLTGCPCGCATRLPYYDDPACLRHKPLPARAAGVFVWCSIDEANGISLFRGHGIGEALRLEGFKPIWSGRARGFVIDLHRTPDACWALERRGYLVRTRERGAA